MDDDDIREIALSLPATSETYPFGPEAAVFKTTANNKIFAILSTPGGPKQTVTLKCDPEESIALREQYESIIPGYHLNKKHWITVDLDGDAPPDLVEQLVRDSHGLVKPKTPRAPRHQ